MDQLPNLGREKEMLDSMGLKSIDDLFSDIPEGVRRVDPLPLRGPQSEEEIWACLLYTSPSPRDRQKSRMPSSA